MPIKHNIQVSEFQEQVLLGTLLGDSSLSRPKKDGLNYHLSCYHSEKQFDWLSIKHNWLSSITRPIQICKYTDKRDGKTRRGARFHTTSFDYLTQLANILYSKGVKRITKEYCDRINHPVALACLICDDGSWDGAGISIATKQFTKRDNVTLANRLEKVFGISVTISHGDYFSLRIPARSVEKVFDMCIEYVPNSMLYKFGGGDYKSHVYVGKVSKVCPVCKREFVSYPSDNKKYCGRTCSVIGKEKGYKTRNRVAVCMSCNNSFTPYNFRQKMCLNCRGKSYPTPCKMCGNNVKRKGMVYCSHRCSVIGSHTTRGHVIHSD